MNNASWSQYDTNDEDPRRHVYRASTAPATSPASAMHPRSLMPRHNLSNPHGRDDYFFAGASRMSIAHDIRDTNPHPAEIPPPVPLYPAHMASAFQRPHSQSQSQVSPPPLPPKPPLPASSNLVHRPSMFFQRPRTNTSPPPLPPKPAMSRPTTPPKLDPSLTFSKPFPQYQPARPAPTGPTPPTPAPKPEPETTVPVPSSSHRPTDSTDEKNLALAIALSQSEQETPQDQKRDDLTAQEDDDLAKALEASLKEAQLSDQRTQEELNSTVAAWLSEGPSKSPGPSKPRGLPSTPPVHTPPRVHQSPQVVLNRLPDHESASAASAPPPDPPSSRSPRANNLSLPVNSGESFIDLSFTPNIDGDEELARRLAAEGEPAQSTAQFPSSSSLPSTPFNRREESTSSTSGADLPRYTSRIVRPATADAPNVETDRPPPHDSAPVILVDRKGPRMKRRSKEQSAPPFPMPRPATAPAESAERTPPPYNEPLPSSASVTSHGDSSSLLAPTSGHGSATSTSTTAFPSTVSPVGHRPRAESRPEIPGLLAPPRNFARNRASSFSDISEGESPIEDSSQNSASSQGVLNMNAFVEQELFIGVTVGFTAPKISPQLLPMPDAMPNIISLPYGRCPPLHLQGPSWRHLLKLMAKLIGTRLEPTMDAVAVNKNELKLRTVVQVIRPHQNSGDWRTILYFTTDFPNPQQRAVENTNELPYSYSLSQLPAPLRDGAETSLSKYFNIPASQSVPFPTLPITFPSLASYLHAALEESRRYMNDSSSGNRRLARMLETCYRNDFEDPQPASPERGQGMGGLFKRVMGRNGRNTRPRRGGNEDTYELVTPFVQEDWG